MDKGNSSDRHPHDRSDSLDHGEAFLLSHLHKDTSNLARCYISLSARIATLEAEKQAAVLAEREACAAKADELGAGWIGDAIRARTGVPNER